MTLSIRQATAADAEDLAGLNGLVQSLHHDGAPEMFKAPDPSSVPLAELFRSWLADPSIHILIGDDVGYDAFGCTGNQFAKTPEVDRLANESLVFDRFYGTVSQCAPIRAELYTGLFPVHNGTLANAQKEREVVLFRGKSENHNVGGAPCAANDALMVAAHGAPPTLAEYR